MQRRNFLAAAGLATAGAGLGVRVVPVEAETAQGLQPVAAARTFTVGKIRVTALADGYLAVGSEVLGGITPEDFAHLTAAAHRPTDPHVIGVNAYLIEANGQRILVDAGSGSLFGPTLGDLPTNLAALGVAPESIDTVIATHLHPDHIGGVVAGDANPFPKAELIASETDRAFWTDDTIKAQTPTDLQGFFDAAQGALGRFGDKARFVSGEADLGHGLTALPLPGHTVGHMGVMIENAGEQLLIWGDVMHFPAIQFARPDVTVGFDTDPDLARSTRMKAFDMVAHDRLMVAGMHLDFPGVGHVERTGDGYRFAPLPYPYGV